MLYKNKPHGDKILILGFSKFILLHNKAVYTNGNASRNDTCFSNDIKWLAGLDYGLIFSIKWMGDEKTKTTMMSELLIPNHVDISLLRCIFCKSKNMKEYLETNYNISHVEVLLDSNQFF